MEDRGRYGVQRRNPILGRVTGEEDTWKLVVPEEYRNRVLKDTHCEATTGHLGIEKRYEWVVQDHWPGGLHDVTSLKPVF